MSLGNLSGGPGKYVPVIISAAWSKAVELSQQASDDIETAIALTTPAPRAASPDPIEAPDVPDAPTLTALNQSTATALYDSTSEDLINTLVELFAGYLGENFGDNNYIDSAQQWIDEALTTGGSGVNTDVEAQLWNRARDRALADAVRSREALEADWAERRSGERKHGRHSGSGSVQRGQHLGQRVGQRQHPDEHRRLIRARAAYRVWAEEPSAHHADS
ncbi:MAG TPA: hypothetical protein PLN33_19920 [Hyphomonadaceae bacterium]|nr:hypothetical protein [Hyphomonadaceae bacterium]